MVRTPFDREQAPGQHSSPYGATSLETAHVKLTDLASCGGCAAKYSAARLEELLRGFAPVDSDDLLVGLAPADDAAVYRLDDDRAIIFTLDFFPPIVDDPPTTARSRRRTRSTTSLRWAARRSWLSPSRPSPSLCRPRCSVRSSPRRTSRCAPRGSPAATIRDEEPKYGLAVVGTVRPDALWPKNGAKPGDSIFLTKPLGTGLIMTGFQQGASGTQPLERAAGCADAEHGRGVRPAPVRAQRSDRRHRLRAVRARARSRRAERRGSGWSRSPAIDGALDLARNGIRTSGDPRNREFAGPHLEVNGAPETLVALGFDPQTAVGCSCRCRPTAGRCSRPSSRRRGCSSGAWARLRRAPGSSWNDPWFHRAGEGRRG